MSTMGLKYKVFKGENNILVYSADIRKTSAFHLIHTYNGFINRMKIATFKGLGDANQGVGDMNQGLR